MYQRNAEPMPASAFFSYPNLNAGLEHRVCEIYAMRPPRLRPPRLTLNTTSPCTLSLPLYSLHGLLSLALSFSLLSHILFLSLDFLLLYHFLFNPLRVYYLDSGDQGFHRLR